LENRTSAQLNQRLAALLERLQQWDRVLEMVLSRLALKGDKP